MRDISSKIFNYNNTEKELDDVKNIICKCSDHDNFINSECEHVATGDISIFKSTELQDILKKGPGYHEPVWLNFDAAYTAITSKTLSRRLVSSKDCAPMPLLWCPQSSQQRILGSIKGC